MKKMLFVMIAAIALSAAACKKKEDKGSGGTAASGPKTMTAQQLFEDFTKLSGADALNAYRDGVIVSGTVLRTGEEGDGSTFVHLDAGNGKWVLLAFADKGAAAKSKGLKKGDAVTAKCGVGGSDGMQVMNTDCELK